MRDYQVWIAFPGQGAQPVIISGPNPPAVRQLAEARYPGCGIGGINMVGGG